MMSLVRCSWTRITLTSMASLLLGGCSTVEPWQRGYLADYAMTPERDPVFDAMAEHAYFSREGASAGKGVGGGGCGCN